jgi:cytochrome c oxidase subunit I
MAQLVEIRDTFRTEYRLTGAYLVIALVALFVGVVTGLFQALSHAGVNLYPQLTPVVASYYQGLTLHGVMNALVWTTFFICGFLQFVATRALAMPLASCRLAWVTYGLMTGGLVLAAFPLLGNAATVMLRQRSRALRRGRRFSTAGAPGWFSLQSCSCWPMATSSSIW